MVLHKGINFSPKAETFFFFIVVIVAKSFTATKINEIVNYAGYAGTNKNLNPISWVYSCFLEPALVPFKGTIILSIDIRCSLGTFM